MKIKVIIALLVILGIAGISNAQNQNIGDTVHAIHYSIHLNEINTATNTITGLTEVTITPLVDDLVYIPLELLDLTVDAVEVDNMVANYNYNGARLQINLDSPVGIADTIIVKVEYHGEPFHESWGGFHFSGDYAFNLGVGFVSIPHNLGKTWFPCIDNFTDRATYDVFGTAPTGLTVTAGGNLVDTIVNGNNTTTWHWNIPNPIPTYLASITLGDYVEYKDEHIGIEDTIPISIFTKPSSAGNVAGSFINLHEIIEFFETRFGPYPFEKIGYTGTAIGAMEHVSNIAYPHSSINGGTSSEYLYTHELAHMWFGNKVTCSTAEDMWLNEGWATFCDIYYKDILYDHETFITEMRATHKDVLQNAHIEDGGYWALNGIPQEVTYGMHAYDKGGIVVNTLRNYLGDSLFFESITAFLNANGIAYNSVSSYDMRDFLSNYTGINMTPFFDAWVMTPGSPHFSIDSSNVTEGNASWMIDIWMKQKYKGAEFLADDNIVEITMIDENFNFFSDTVHFSGETGHSQKIYDMATMPNKPVMVTMDLFEKTNDATSDNFMFISSPDNYEFPQTYFTLLVDAVEDSVLIRTTHNWVAPDSLKTPIEGLTLSPYRHWEIEGIIDENFSAQGKFFYNTSGNLDDGLITSINDSIVILYRPDASHDWVEIPQTRVGVWMVGNIIVDDLLPGEYTLAVWDKQIVGNSEIHDNSGINVYPNPTKGIIYCNLSNEVKYQINMYDERGVVIDSLFEVSGINEIKIPDNTKSGVIIIEILSDEKVVGIEKVMLIK